MMYDANIHDTGLFSYPDDARSLYLNYDHDGVASVDQQEHQYVLRDNLDSGTGSHHNAIIYEFLRLLIGPFHVLMDHRRIIVLTLYTRITHLLIDLTSLKHDHKFLLKDVILCYMGFQQILEYYKKSEPDKYLGLFVATLSMIIFGTVVAKFFNQINIKQSRLRSLVLICLIASPIIINEISTYLLENQHLITMRPVLMILAMKITSSTLSFGQPGIPSLVGYFLHPASCIFGPWHIYETYKPTPRRDLVLRQFFRQTSLAAVSLSKTLIVLIISLNLTEVGYFIESYADNHLLLESSRTYLSALEFRFSHYFACLLSATLMQLWGRKDQQVCDIIKVEWPRSLVEVVVSWNIPMHEWLKRNIFKTLIESKLSMIYVVLTTYLCSSLLHGFKFHIWAVLLSLGFATWIEHRLRFRLSQTFSACVLARPCKLISGRYCTRKHSKTTGYTVFIINLMFRILSIVQLAYLGSIFIGNTDLASYLDAVRIWSHNYFYGHILCLIMYFGELMISKLGRNQLRT